MTQPAANGYDADVPELGTTTVSLSLGGEPGNDRAYSCAVAKAISGFGKRTVQSCRSQLHHRYCASLNWSFLASCSMVGKCKVIRVGPSCRSL